MTDLFKQIFVAKNLEAAAVTTLRAWWPVYSREIEIQGAITQNALPMPRSFVSAEKFDRSNSDQLPSVVVISPGLSGKRPVKNGDGTYQVYFAMAVGVFVSAKDRSSTHDLLRLYTAIIRSIMIQKSSLGGFVAASDWIDESYDDVLDFNDTETFGAGQVVFELMVDDVVSKFGGPQGDPMPAPNPATQPGSNWPLVATTKATVEVKES